MKKKTSKNKLPGFFGDFGGCYSPEVLMPAIQELDEVYGRLKNNKKFKEQFKHYSKEYTGRPSSLTFADRLSDEWKAKVYLKREDLNHTGAHKINNALGQALLAKHMNKKRLIAETGAGQHGVATATVAAKFGFECVIYMGEEDMRRQKLNCIRMELLGAKLIPVKSGTGTLKDATNEAMRDWAKSVGNTHYVIGSVIGPHPFPTMVRDFQSIIGAEARKQILKSAGKLPDAVIACVGGGSNAIGIFHGFIKDKKVKLIGVEAGGRGDSPGDNSATITFGSTGFFHGTKSLFIQSEEGQITNVHSISAGLDYPGIGPEHAYLAASKRASYFKISDKQALLGFTDLCRLEGIIPALESSHAIAYAKEYAKKNKNSVILINLSGRGDKDVSEAAQLLQMDGYQ